MSSRLIVASAIAALASACGDDGGSSRPDAATDAVAPPTDAAIDAAVDAAACVRPDYPMVVRPTTVDTTTPEPITLSGTGTRCEQIIAALLGPAAGRPRGLAAMDVTGATATCEHDDVTNREIVRVRAPSYLGEPLFWPVQDALVHVDSRNQLVFQRADFLPLGAAAVTGCLSEGEVTAVAADEDLTYLRFAACAPQGPGTYPMAAGDPVVAGAEGYYLDEDQRLHRVRAVDAYVAPGHVTSELINSDLYCCASASLESCVGQRLFIDVITGLVIGRATHCHTC